MNDALRQKCLDYVTGSLDSTQAAVFEQELADNAELQALVSQYGELMSLEQAISDEQPAVGAHFSVKVMDALEREATPGFAAGFFSGGLLERYFAMSRKVILPLGATCAVLLAVFATNSVKRERGLEISRSADSAQSYKVPLKAGRSPGDQLATAPAGPIADEPLREKQAAAKSEAAEESEADSRLAVSNQIEQPQAAAPQDADQKSDLLQKNAFEAQEQVSRGATKQAAKELTRSEAIPPATSGYAGKDSGDVDKRPVIQPARRAQGEFLRNQTSDAPAVAPKQEWLQSERKAKESEYSEPANKPADSEGRREYPGAKGNAVPQEVEAMRDDEADDDFALGTQNSTRLTDTLSLRGGGAAPEKMQLREDGLAGAGIKPALRTRESSDQKKLRQEPVAKRPAPISPGAYIPAPPPQPRVQSGEEYGIYDENQRTSVAREPRSTFSADVDTGSYSNVRRFLSMGQMPPVNAVRVEELVNYFTYAYPSQSEKPFAVHYEIAPSPFSKGRHLLKLGIKAKDAAAAERKPWNLVFLIDVSGSMESANKLPLLKKSFQVLLQNLRDQDHVALVTYASGAQVVLPATAGSNRELIRTAMNGLIASGSTNGEAGIAMAYAEAERFKQPGSVNRVIVATDGDFNVGASSFEELMAMIERKRESGITLTTLGFGEANLKEKTLEQLSDRGNGNYFYIDTFAEARKVFEQQLAQNMEVVAKDVKLQIEFNPAQVSEYRLIGYDNRRLANQDFANDAVDAGEIGAGHTVTALYEIALAGAAVADEVDEELRYQKPAPSVEPAAKTEEAFGAELAFVKIRFKAPDGSTSEKMQFPIEKSQVKAAFADGSTDFRFAAGVAGFGQLLRGSKYGIGYNYSDVAVILNAATGADANGERRQFLQLVDNARALKR